MAALAVPSVEPIPAKSEAAAVSASGAANRNDIRNLRGDTRMVARSPLARGQVRETAGKAPAAAVVVRGCRPRSLGSLALVLRVWHRCPKSHSLGHADEIRSWGSYTNVPLTPGEEPTALPSPVVPPKVSASA